MKPSRLIPTSLLFAVLFAVPVLAQEPPRSGDQPILGSAAMDDALANHESQVDRNRAELARILAHPQVRELARDRGVDMSRVETGAAGLTDEQMEEVAPLVAKVAPLIEQRMGSVTVSVAAIIIILLILILVT
ncbi:MAG: hypothetical protein EA352_07435 [Gemmatimonadales bacterium]|nr:MAG: hypothetical protein EA352_07435 [Gemmatimonadales bacterium]